MKHFAVSLLVILSITAAKAQVSTKQGENNAFVLGVVDEIKSALLSEKRILNIYLPEGYDKDTAHYPVIYLLDGSANEDFVHVVGVAQFLNMIEAMPKTIIVGIANVDRRRDFTFPTTIDSDKIAYPTTGSSEKFMLFVEKELQPYVQHKYRTNGQRTIIGQSLGGLFASEVLIKKPYLFDNYIIVSPSLWWDKESLLSKLDGMQKLLPNRPMNVYITAGNEGDVMVGDAKRLYAKLLTFDRPQLNVKFNYLPDENHLTILHNAVYKCLMQQYQKRMR